MRPILVGHAVDLATAPPPPATTAESKPTSPLAQRGLRSLDPPVQRAGRGHDGRARRPRPSQPRGFLPHRRPPRPHPGRTQRTRERTDTDTDADSGHRTPDTRTFRRPHRTLDTGRVDRHAWRLDVRTGHRTPAAGRGCGHTDEGTAGVRTSWATMPSGRALGHPTLFLWTAPAALGDDDGSAWVGAF
jgi:hypothetical protein